MHPIGNARCIVHWIAISTFNRRIKIIPGSDSFAKLFSIHLRSPIFPNKRENQAYSKHIQQQSREKFIWFKIIMFIYLKSFSICCEQKKKIGGIKTDKFIFDLKICIFLCFLCLYTDFFSCWSYSYLVWILCYLCFDLWFFERMIKNAF